MGCSMKKYFLYVYLSTGLIWAAEDKSWEKGDVSSSIQEYNRYLQQAIQDQDWWGVIDYADLISYNFPKSPFAQDMAFAMGEAYFNLWQLELANTCFSDYLNHTSSPRHFEKAIEYKFNIAEQFRNGVKKPLFGSHKMPKWLPAKEDAVAIYDEVIT